MQVVGASRPAAAAAFFLSLGLMVATAAQAASSSAGTPDDPAYLDQAWSARDRSWFYTTSQGSRLLPYAWFLALEQPDSETPFRDDGLARFGYLPNPASPDNRDGLPVGFVRDDDIGGAGSWVGMTCAACHTSQIEFRGQEPADRRRPGQRRHVRVDPRPGCGTRANGRQPDATPSSSASRTRCWGRRMLRPLPTSSIATWRRSPPISRSTSPTAGRRRRSGGRRASMPSA